MRERDIFDSFKIKIIFFAKRSNEVMIRTQSYYATFRIYIILRRILFKNFFIYTTLQLHHT